MEPITYTASGGQVMTFGLHKQIVLRSFKSNTNLRFDYDSMPSITSIIRLPHSTIIYEIAYCNRFIDNLIRECEMAERIHAETQVGIQEYVERMQIRILKVSLRVILNFTHGTDDLFF
jgi:hypothetical protein